LFVDYPTQLAQEVGTEECSASTKRDDQIGLVDISPFEWQRSQTSIAAHIRDAIPTPVVAHREEIEALSS